MQHQLHPFKATPLPLTITFNAVQSGSQWTFNYQVHGAIHEVAGLDDALQSPQRADEIWKATCFEWFLKFPSLEKNKYWEFNAAPDGRWNFYELQSYRMGLAPSPLLGPPLFLSMPTGTLKHSSYAFSFKVNTEALLTPLKASTSQGLLAITAVVDKPKEG